MFKQTLALKLQVLFSMAIRGILILGQSLADLHLVYKVLADLHLDYKEVLAVVMAAENWCDQCTDRHIIIHPDYQAAVSIISKGSTKNPIISCIICTGYCGFLQCSISI